MPILKQLVSSTNQSKRRSRADLTAEMISAPLGDFRHTMHVGRGGDAFGDTSFLSSRSGEAPREAEPMQAPPAGPKPGLLSRTFRSSKRSQSVNRGDKYQYKTVAAGAAAPPGGGTSGFVKNAISLPYLNNDHEELSSRGAPPPPPMAKSVSSSPLRTNGGAAIAKLDPELDERNFGELTELPPSLPRGGGMKHAESMMSFHIDLGPSMLGDILGVMEKKGWEEDDLGYEEGRPSPSHIPLIDDDGDDDDLEGEELKVGVGTPPARPPRSLPQLEAEPYSPELQTRNNNYQQHQDSCSVSSSGSALEDKRRYYGGHDGDTDSAKFSSPRAGGGGGGGSFGGAEDDRDFSYMDEEDEDDEEIRV
ncbi:cdc42 effector protein 4-like [Nelusetta ayraudi]|uniref:cdc42 effector protein 4-like n=1 Tax=Nelusetta ayraudi TaxID=303726 RepID=UPI003F7216A4